MQRDETTSFNDPDLKAALRRCCGDERASTELRSRILATLAQASESSEASSNSTQISAGPTQPVMLTSSGTPRFHRDTLPGLAPGFPWMGAHWLVGVGIAAVLLVAVGFVAVRLAEMGTETVPTTLAQAMVARHDLCCTAETHQDPMLAHISLPKLSGVLQGELGHPVLAANLVADGWHFRGVAKCPVGSTVSAHFLFDKDGQTVSVFSLPGSVDPTMETGHRYEAAIQNHLLVCYATQGAVIGYVAHGRNGNLKMPQLESLVHEHESDPSTPPSALAPTERQSIAQLIRDER